ncbi:MAG: hypothetical protein ACK4N5_27215, partial [Myxococcales bacterium]
GLERLDQEQRRQALESSVARTFRNGTLTGFEVVEPEGSGEPVSIRYQFVAPGFARVAGNRLMVSRGLYPANLSRRYVALATRQTPLLVGSAERTELEATLTLPKGMKLLPPPQPQQLSSEYGAYARSEQLEDGRLVLRESVELKLARIPPQRYPGFVDFVTGIDRVQAREWELAQTP